MALSASKSDRKAAPSDEGEAALASRLCGGCGLAGADFGSWMDVKIWLINMPFRAQKMTIGFCQFSGTYRNFVVSSQRSSAHLQEFPLPPPLTTH